MIPYKDFRNITRDLLKRIWGIVDFLALKD